MKIGILTFHNAHNFGALLQCYALRSYLKSKYAYVDIINYSPDALTRRYDLFPYYPYQKTFGEFKNAIRAFSWNLRNLPAYCQRSRKMRRFISEYLAVSSRKLKSADELESLEYDCLIMGSDQIWNPDITLGMDRAFFGDFASPASSKRIAYAASMGRDRLEGRYLEAFKSYMANFSAISVRESSAVPFVREYATCPICAVCDPVFLLTGGQWRDLSQKAEAKIRNPYVLVYYTEYNPDLIEFAERVAREKALPLILLNRNDARGSKRHRYLTGIGPLDFLLYIANAGYVVTNSFHATALSVLLHKQFMVFSHSSLGARIMDLFGTLGLSSRLARNSDVRTSDCNLPKWEMVDAAIVGIRKTSTLYLEVSIGAKA